MKDKAKTKKQLLEELESTRRELELLKSEPASSEPSQSGKTADSSAGAIEGPPEIILNSMSELVAVIDGSGTFLYMNSETARNLGKPNADSGVGTTVADYFPAESSRNLLDIINTVIESNTALSREVELELPVGRRRFVIDYRPLAYPSAEGNIPAVLSVSQDITAQKKAEQRLLYSLQELSDTQALVNAVIDQSPLPMVIAEAPTTKIRIYNKACKQTLGIEDEPDYTGTNLYDLHQTWQDFTPAGTEVPMKDLPLARALQGETVRGMEVRVVRKDGSERWIMVYGTPIYNDEGKLIAAHIIFPDITDRKLAEQKLEDKRKELSRALERVSFHVSNSPLAVIERRKGDTIHKWSEQAESLFGRKAYEVMGQKWEDAVFFHQDDLEYVSAEMQSLFDREIDHNIIQCRNLHQDGSILHCRWYNSALRDENGNMLSILSQVENITERMEAQEELDKNRQYLQSLYENSSIGIFVVDVNPDGSYTYAGMNPTLEQIVNVPPNAILGKSPEALRDYFEGEVVDDIIGLYDRCIQEERTIEIEHHETIDNQDTWWLSRVTPLRDETGRFYRIIGNALLITERKQMEEAVRQSEALLKETGNIARIGGWEHDLRAGTARWTEALFDIFEMQNTEPPGPDKHLDYYPPHDRAVLDRAIQNAIAERSSFDLELRVYTASRKLIWTRVIGHTIFENGECIKLKGTVQDITDRKNAELELKESERSLRLVVKKAPYPICILDEKFEVETVNDTFTATFGYTSEDMENLENWWRNAYPDPEYRNQVRSAWQDAVEQALESGKDMQPQEWRIMDKNGTIRHVEFRMVPMGRRSLVAMLDLTPFRTLQAEIIKAKDNAETANKSKSEFLANMSHEIRTPLNGIMGMLQLLKQTNLSEEQRNYTDSAVTGSRQLATLLGDILDLSGIESGKIELREKVFSVDELFASVESIFHDPAAQKNIRLRTIVHPQVPKSLYGDEGRLRQILFNLVGNAVKFTDRGDITMEAWPVQSENHRTPHILFSVTDTGLGIPDELQAKMFDSFTQAEHTYTRRFSGVGLGLAIVKRLVGLMHGSAAVESMQGHGTAVHLCLPFRPAPDAYAKPVSTLAETSESYEAKTVLVVEDEPISLAAAKHSLEQAGFTVLTAPDGAKALAVFKENHVDLILMDIRMPIMNGIEATRAIRTSPEFKEKRHTPIIALTAYAMSGNKETFLNAGMNDFLEKPVDFDTLQEVVVRNLQS